MKTKLILVLIFIFSLTCNLFSQTEWITELPVFGDAYSMLKTTDSCYVVLKRPVYYNEDSTDYIYDLQLSKVNSDGEILWYKTVISDTLNFAYLSFIQLSNENFFITGKCSWCPFYAITSSEGELIYFSRLSYYLDIPNNYSIFYAPVEMSNSEIWVLGGDSQLYITKINIENNLIEVDSSSLCLPSVWPTMEKINENRLMVTNGGQRIYIIDSSQNVINQASFSFNFFNPRYKPFQINPFDGFYYFYGQSLDPYPNERYGFWVLNQQLDSIKFIDNYDFYPNQSQGQYPRVLDFDFPKPDNITMTGYIYWYSGYEQELPFILNYNIAEDTVDYYHAYVNSVTRYSINLLKEGNGYVMLTTFLGYPGFVFLLKENTGLGNKIVNIDYYDGISIYPNPANNHITISSIETSFNEIIIFDFGGRIIRQIKLNEVYHTDIPVNGLSAGKYTIKILSKNNSYIKPFIKI